VLDATAIANVRSRLPDPVNQGVDPALPLRVVIEPPGGCGLVFEDEYDAEFDATNLVFNPASPYRLMKAPVGGAFEDITNVVDAGSVRARGCGGTFSEFVLVRDQAQNYTSELIAAFAGLSVTTMLRSARPHARRWHRSPRQPVRLRQLQRSHRRSDDLTEHSGILGDRPSNRWRSARDPSTSKAISLPDPTT
jgi:hypothetical protein